jgi:oligosaccharyltransferase complex subunit gamma
LFSYSRPLLGPPQELMGLLFDMILAGEITQLALFRERILTEWYYRPTKADQVYSWLSRHLPDGPKPELVRPINYIRIAAVTTTILGFITLFSAMSPYILPVIRNRNIWAALSLISILLFTSGHMFNHIRKVPYVAGDGKGGISYFAAGFSTQFGMETQIVAAICKSLSLCLR